uniref:ATP synthase F0 subunit 6 n=1 Tax=Sclerodermus sichuanensis TaxID=592144 RepID=UPI00211449CA|nr:ATP synthase F0 subunit 6 [Sclerodermus sichuanensis]UTN43172.1 ATP synthase F0 subunit 6 [Sclerodermus sichuanensis]
MMTNLFSNFDPSTSFYLSLNWISILIPFFILTPSYWTIFSNFNILPQLIKTNIFKEYKILSNKYYTNIYFFVSLIIFLMLVNFMGLIPFIFTPTSQMSLSLSISLPLWISIMIFNMMMHTNQLFTHLVPKNTPFPLMPLMVIIETTSNIIRPLTLAIRISANMIAGHLLLTLIGSQFINSPIFAWMPIFIPQMLLTILEMSVSLIQAYVFATLSILYSAEI